MSSNTDTDYAARLALFLTEKKGSCLANWSGHLLAAEQRQLFGRFLGKGNVRIDGADETIEHHRKVCFGLDTECTASLKWGALAASSQKAKQPLTAALA